MLVFKNVPRGSVRVRIPPHGSVRVKSIRVSASFQIRMTAPDIYGPEGSARGEGRFG